MEKITFTNALGKSLVLSYDGNYLIKSYSGFGGSEIIPTSTSGFRQNGQTLVHTGLGTRVMEISFFIFTSNGMQDFYARRAELGEIFNPLFGTGILKYENDYLSREISCVTTQMPQEDEDEKYGNLRLYTVELTAFNPFWRDSQAQIITINDFLGSGGLCYPITQLQNIYGKIKQNLYIDNLGQYEAPVEITFFGAAARPRLEIIGTNKKIEMGLDIDYGENIIVNTEYGNKTVIKEDYKGNRESAYQYLSKDSSFFTLPVGRSYIQFSNGNPDLTSKAQIAYRNYYLGV